jgi:thiol-disulfide isomerase/thioredoxin
MKKIIFTLLLMSTMVFSQDTNFIIKDSDNNTIHVTDLKQGLLFQEYQGKAVFLLMFGHNCPPCREEIPELINLANKYKDKLEIVAIEVQGYENEELAKFKKSENINYHLVSGDNNQDFVQHIFIRSGWKGQIPFLIAIDKRGEVKDIRAGLIPESTLKGLIESLNK